MQIQTVANALCPKDIERLSQSLPAAHTHLTEFRRTLISRWVEAYPTGRVTAAHTAKCLVNDFIPRWGLPDCIDSDQGTHFTGQVVKEVSRMLRIKWNLHCPYRPQASGQVDLRNADVHIVSDALIAYCENLTKAVQSAKRELSRVGRLHQKVDTPIVPGQWVMIKAFKNKPLEPKWYGPHQVMLITAAASIVSGKKKTWTHVSHCRVVPPPAGIG